MSDSLGESIARMRAAWPALEVDDAQLRQFLAERAPLDDLCLDDLYLACACVLGHPAAIRQFEAKFAGDLDAVLRQMRVGEPLRDEIRQQVRDKVLVPRGDAPPKIADYSGRGPLANWLRAVATRAALDLLRKNARAPASDSELLDTVPAAIEDPEARALRQRYAPEFAAAFREALAALPARDRLLLKRHFIDELSTDELGRLHRVHRVTVLRWLTAALDTLTTHAQGLLLTRLKLPRSEYESIVRLVRSQLDISIGTLLE
jgi:RNA polymerase sigma-70 factor (ECF subfamily)